MIQRAEQWARRGLLRPAKHHEWQIAVTAELRLRTEAMVSCFVRSVCRIRSTKYLDKLVSRCTYMCTCTRAHTVHIVHTVYSIQFIFYLYMLQPGIFSVFYARPI